MKLEETKNDMCATFIFVPSLSLTVSRNVDATSLWLDQQKPEDLNVRFDSQYIMYKRRLQRTREFILHKLVGLADNSCETSLHCVPGPTGHV